jgi:hypothetical protein
MSENDGRVVAPGEFAVQPADYDNTLIAEVADEFASRGAVVDERSGVLAHLKASVVAAAASGGKPVDEAGYLAALAAVDGGEGSVARRHADSDSVEVHVRAAAALADLAAENLRQSGAKRTDADYADLYTREVERVGRAFGVPYRSKGV